MDVGKHENGKEDCGHNLPSALSLFLSLSLSIAKMTFFFNFQLNVAYGLIEVKIIFTILP